MNVSNLGEPVPSATDLRLTADGLIDTSSLVSCPITARNRQLSPLIRLPAELRNAICFMALETDCIIITDHPSPQSKPSIILKGWRNVGPPAQKPLQGKLFEGKPYYVLSAVCRQLYEETCLLPYALNTFSLIICSRMDAWLASRLPVQHNAIVSMKVAENMVTDYWFARDWTFVGVFPNLKQLYVDLWSLPKRYAGPRSMSTDEQLTKVIAGLKSQLEQKERSGINIIATGCDIRGEAVRGL